MKRRKSQVAGLGYAKRGLRSFKVAHFADQHYVRVLAQRRAERVGKRMRIGVNFALVYYAALVRVKILYRVFYGDYVLVAVAVDLVEHCRKRG